MINHIKLNITFQNEKHVTLNYKIINNDKNNIDNNYDDTKQPLKTLKVNVLRAVFCHNGDLVWLNDLV